MYFIRFASFFFFFSFSLFGLTAQNLDFTPQHVDTNSFSKRELNLYREYRSLFHLSDHPLDRLSIYTEFLNEFSNEEYWQLFNQQFLEIAQQTVKTAEKKNIDAAKRYLGVAFNNEGYVEDILGNKAKALDYYHQALELYQESGEQNEQGTIYNNIGYIFKEAGQLDSALLYFQMAKKKHWKAQDLESYALLLNNEAFIFDIKGDKLRALQQYDSARSIQEQIRALGYLSSTLGNLALLHGEFGDSLLEINYLKRALKLDDSLEDFIGVTNLNINIGDHFLIYDRPDTALRFFRAAQKMSEKYELPQTLGYSYHYLAEVFLKRKNLDSAWYYIKRSDSIAVANNIAELKGYVYLNKADYFILKTDQQNAMRSAETAWKIGKSGKNDLIMQSALNRLIDLYEKAGNFKKAYLLQKKLDSIADTEGELKEQRALLESEFRRERQLIQRNDSLNRLLIQQKNREQMVEKEAELSSSRWQRGLLGGGLILSLIASRFIYLAYRRKKKDRALIEAQKDEVSLQRDIANKSLKKAEKMNLLLELKNKEILESIEYAKRLQEAVLPPKKLVKEWLTSSFILYKPKDIVSGDFYWMESAEYEKDGKRGSLIFFAVADCTGHGVPGAMVSVLCASALNRAVKEYKISDVGDILNKVSELVIEGFKESEEDIYDGMDIALCGLDLGKKELHFTGANNPLWVISRSEDLDTKENYKTHQIEEINGLYLHEIKGQRKAVGLNDSKEQFSTRFIQLKPGDSLYLFSDGYVDQFGGADGKKFKSARLKELLLKSYDQEMQSQRSILDKTLEDWRGELQQVDDICIMGVKVNGIERRNFTKREIEVLELLREGLPSKLIADKLRISPHTVDTYRRRLLSKTSSHNTTELLQYVKDKEII